MKIDVKYMRIKGYGISDGQAYETEFEVVRPSRVKFIEAFVAKKCAEKNLIFGNIVAEGVNHYEIPEEVLREFEVAE